MSVMAQSIRSIDDLLDSTRASQARAESLTPLSDPPELLDPAPFIQAIADIDSTEKTVFVCTQTVTKLNRELTNVEKGVRAWAKANPDCPLCGSLVSANSLLEGVHAHG